MKSDTYEAGLAVRREVLGADHVDAAIGRADDFSGPLQDFITEHAWGAVWTRPGLERKTRSMLNIALLTALNRPHELKLHLRGALTNGVSREEIREILLHCAVYCGAPAAVDGFRTAQQVLSEAEDAKPAA